MSFKRAVSLTVAKPQSLFIAAPNATVITGLRVRFKIEKTIGKTPNKCAITVSNLSQESRAIFDVKPVMVRLDAGYEGEIERLFIGDLITGDSIEAGADWETILNVSDGARAYAHSRVNRSFPAGTTLRAAITDVARSLGLVLPKLEGADFSTRFRSGVSLFGLAHREMSRLLKPYDLLWSIQDGRLQILKSTSAHKGVAIIISQDTGMQGSPEFGVPEKKGKPPILTVKSTLKPALSPGGYIKVESIKHNGVFRLNSVTHEGDTHGDDWRSTMEAVQL